MEFAIDEIVSWTKTMRLEVDNNYIDELVEEHNLELTTKEFMELHSVTQQDVKISSEEEEATASDR